MSRYTGPCRIRIHGPQGAGAAYVGLARGLLGEQIAIHVDAYDSSRGLASDSAVTKGYTPKPIEQIQRRVQLSNGTRIRVQYNTYMPIIDIWLVGVEETEKEEKIGGYIIWSRDFQSSKFGVLRDSLLQINGYVAGVPPIPLLDTDKEAAHVLWTDEATGVIYSCNPSGSNTFDDGILLDDVVRYRPAKQRSLYHPNSPGSSFVTTLRTSQQIVWAGQFYGEEAYYAKGEKTSTTGIRVIAVGTFNGDRFIAGRPTGNNTIQIYRLVDNVWVVELSTTITAVSDATVLFNNNGEILFTHTTRGVVTGTAIGANGFSITNAELTIIQIIPSIETPVSYTYNYIVRTHTAPILYYTIDMDGAGITSYIQASHQGEDHLCLDWDDYNSNVRLKSLVERANIDSSASRTFDGDNIFTVTANWQNEIWYSKYAIGGPSPGIITKSIDEQAGEQEYLIGTYGMTGTVTGEYQPSSETISCLTGQLYYYGGLVSGSFTNKRFLLVDADLRYDTVCFIESEVVFTPTSTTFICSLTSVQDNGPYTQMNFTASITTYTLKVWRKGEIVYAGQPHTGRSPYDFTWTLYNGTPFNSQRWVDDILGLSIGEASVARYREYRNPITQLTALRRPRASFLCRDPYSFAVSVRWSLPGYPDPSKPYADEAIFWQQPPGVEIPEVYNIAQLLTKAGLDIATVDLETFTAFPIRAF